MKKTRSHRTPVSIKIAVGLWLLIAATKIVSTISMAIVLTPFGAQKFAFGSQVFGLVFALYQAIALARLSRWPMLLQPAVAAASILSLYASGFDWRERYPILGPLAMILPPLILLALTLPHWRKMNWGVFGRPYRPPEDQADVFT
jgi:hypothetical protein